ncbi:winged helix-turn-helix transcriptional regulator [Schlesneria paludicola]|uniref:winged helix-turn-helix transcriptional regulator n=1 Tax=Schlesneria paludicola TaxID=360056 RepID=UPI0012F7BCFF
MATINSIETLHRSGRSNREISRLLGVDRGAVNRAVQRLKAAEVQNRPNPLTGSSQTIRSTIRRIQLQFTPQNLTGFHSRNDRPKSKN